MRWLFRDNLGLISLSFLSTLIYCIGACFSYSLEESLSGSILFMSVAAVGILFSYILERLSEKLTENEPRKGLYFSGLVFNILLLCFYTGFILAVYIYNGSIEPFTTSLGLSCFIYCLGSCLLVLLAIIRFALAFFWPDKARDADSNSFLTLALTASMSYLGGLIAFYALGEFIIGHNLGSTAEMYPYYPFIFYWVVGVIALINYIVIKNKRVSDLVSFFLSLACWLYFLGVIVPLAYYQPYYYFNGIKGLLFIITSFSCFMLSSVLLASTWPKKKAKSF